VRGILSFVLGLAFVACDGPDLAVLEVCDAYCDCSTVVQTQADACTDACLGQLEGRAVPEACLVCARESACVELENCFDVCFDIPEGT
jgi:hypothetical protein